MKYLVVIIVALAIVLSIPSKTTYIHLETAYAEELQESPKEYAKRLITEKWGVEQWVYFDDLVKRESKWNSEAKNPNSTAYGLGQFLNSTWKDVGCTKTSDPYTQIDCTVKYVNQRYSTPEKAIAWHNKRNWY